jgi:hypothetical protein
MLDFCTSGPDTLTPEELTKSPFKPPTGKDTDWNAGHGDQLELKTPEASLSKPESQLSAKTGS